MTFIRLFPAILYIECGFHKTRNEYNDENYGNDNEAHDVRDFGAKLGICILRRFGWYMLFSTKRGRGVIPGLQKLKRGFLFRRCAYLTFCFIPSL